MPESKPLYLVWVCPNCINIRHFKPKDDSYKVYYCPVCRLEVSYDNGVITKLGTFYHLKQEASENIPYKIPFMLGRPKNRW